jgi:hypothetical protein
VSGLLPRCFFCVVVVRIAEEEVLVEVGGLDRERAMQGEAGEQILA